jgi:cell filamentation protein
MYEVADDTYCYPGATVLKNKLNIQSQQALDDAEVEFTDLRASDPMPDGAFDYAHYKAVHHHIFQDLFDWAGEPRTVRISKGNSAFCYPEHIEKQANKIFADLADLNHLNGLNPQEFAKQAAHFLAELNALHPYRDGNGRTQLSFLVILAANAGYTIDTDKLDPERVMPAMIESFSGNELLLEELVVDLITR